MAEWVMLVTAILIVVVPKLRSIRIDFKDSNDGHDHRERQLLSGRTHEH